MSATWAGTSCNHTILMWSRCLAALMRLIEIRPRQADLYPMTSFDLMRVWEVWLHTNSGLTAAIARCRFRPSARLLRTSVLEPRTPGPKLWEWQAFLTGG